MGIRNTLNRTGHQYFRPGSAYSKRNPYKVNSQLKMLKHTPHRILVNSIDLIDATDLLYYDAFVNPFKKRIPFILVPPPSGIPLEVIQAFPNIMKKVRELEEKLVDVGIIISREAILNTKALNEFDENEHSKWLYNYREILSYDPDPWGTFNTKSWFEHTQIQEFAHRSLKKSISIVPKYGFSNFSKMHQKGNSEVLSIIFSYLPKLEMLDLNVNDLVDFLLDEETQIKRRRLFSWQNGIENKIKKSDLKIEQLFDMIATYLDDYTTWLKKSKQKLKYERREIVYYFLTSIFTVFKLPDAFTKYFEFKKRKLDLLDDEKAPGRELAYVVHVNEEFSK